MSAPEYQVTTLDLLRHGKPEGGEIFRGSIDVELSAQGFEQMEKSVKKLEQAAPEWDYIISSPLSRCRIFAEQLATRQRQTVEIEEAFKEINFGLWEGKTFSEVKAMDEMHFQRFWEDPIKHTPPKGEPFSLFAQRVNAGLNNLLTTHAGSRLLLVTHGGVIRVIVDYCLGGNGHSLMRYEVPYACLSQIRIFEHLDSRFYQLCFHNK